MNRGALFHLPFLHDYNPLYRRFLTVSRTEIFLGASFYPRLNNIYINLLDAISKKNYRYLSANLEASLAAQLLSEMKALDESRLKIRVQSPVVRTAVQRKKKFEKWTGFRERVWSNGVTQIGVQCCVYFGRKFDQQNPMEKGNFYRVGEFRYLQWQKELGLGGNLKNWFDEQTYELTIRYKSKMYLRVVAPGEVGKEEEEGDKQVMSELVLRSGNKSFDWVVVRMNDLTPE